MAMNNVITFDINASYPYVVNLPHAKWSEQFDWCHEVIDYGISTDNWVCFSLPATAFGFKFEKDAMLFALRWL